MPRLLGVDIPNDRPTVISLTYLYGVGPKIARDLCHKAGDRSAGPCPRTPRGRVGAAGGLAGQGLRGRRAVAAAAEPEHRPAEGHRLLPRHSAPPRPAGPRPAHPHQRPHPQGPEEDRGRQEGREGSAVSGVGRFERIVASVLTGWSCPSGGQDNDSSGNSTKKGASQRDRGRGPHQGDVQQYGRSPSPTPRARRSAGPAPAPAASRAAARARPLPARCRPSRWPRRPSSSA